MKWVKRTMTRAVAQWTEYYSELKTRHLTSERSNKVDGPRRLVLLEDTVGKEQGTERRGHVSQSTKMSSSIVDDEKGGGQVEAGQWESEEDNVGGRAEQEAIERQLTEWGEMTKSEDGVRVILCFERPVGDRSTVDSELESGEERARGGEWGDQALKSDVLSQVVAHFHHSHLGQHDHHSPPSTSVST
jgi:hypothetical protein